jgi:hypothetical protein
MPSYDLLKNTGIPVDQITQGQVYVPPTCSYNFAQLSSKSLNMKTLKHLSMSVLSLALAIILMTGCKKDKGGNNNSKRNVKYELTGTFTGKFHIIISDNESGSQTYNDVTIPWSKEVSYDSKILSVGIGTAITTYGVAGQTAFLKIYSGGSVVKSSNGTADNNGVITVPSLGHVF